MIIRKIPAFLVTMERITNVKKHLNKKALSTLSVIIIIISLAMTIVWHIHILMATATLLEEIKISREISAPIDQVWNIVSDIDTRNVDTILTDQDTKLPNASIDIIFLFRVLHDFENPDIIIRELDRVLTPTGILLVIDHKFDKGKVISTITCATQNLRLRETMTGNNKEKNAMHIFSKLP